MYSFIRFTSSKVLDVHKFYIYKPINYRHFRWILNLVSLLVFQNG
jgi:hypothetical protein